MTGFLVGVALLAGVFLALYVEDFASRRRAGRLVLVERVTEHAIRTLAHPRRRP